MLRALGHARTMCSQLLPVSDSVGVVLVRLGNTLVFHMAVFHTPYWVAGSWPQCGRGTSVLGFPNREAQNSLISTPAYPAHEEAHVTKIFAHRGPLDRHRLAARSWSLSSHRNSRFFLFFATPRASGSVGSEDEAMEGFAWCESQASLHGCWIM